jgi:hypothetical protein
MCKGACRRTLSAPDSLDNSTVLERAVQFESRVVSQAVAVKAAIVYDFARRMQNLPGWASGLAAGVQREDGVWFTESPMGLVAVAIAPENAFGVLDHDVTLPDGTVVYNAFRVSPSGDGSVLTFVVLRLPGVRDDAFAADVAHVRRDLRALKRLLESR